MSFELNDRIKETTTTTSTGTLTLAGAVTGYRSFADIGNANSTEFLILAVDASGIPTGDWEVSVGVYTSSGTTLSRLAVLSNSAGTGLLQSGAGTKISFAAGTKHVSCGVGKSTLYPRNDIVNGRLTTESGVFLSTGDRLSQATIYFTPFGGNKISLYENGQWITYQFSELSIAVSGTVGQIRDIFGYNNAGTLTLEFGSVWPGDNTRPNSPNAFTIQDGVYCKFGDASKRYLGTIRLNGTNVTEDSHSKRFVWNYYNRLVRFMYVKEATNSWTYSTQAWRQTNASSANQIEFISGDPIAQVVTCRAVSVANGDAGGQAAACGIGASQTTVNSARIYGANAPNGFATQFAAHYTDYAGPGYWYFAWLEAGSGAGVQTWYGDAGSTFFQAGLVAETLG